MAKNYRNLIVGEKPASWWGATWREGYFSGNGTVGANAYGGAKHERILLNHASLGHRGRTNVLPDISLKMKEVKKAVDDGDFMAAQKVLPNALAAKNFRPSPLDPLPLCLLKIDTDTEGGIKDYRRTLDMESGEVSVSFADGTGKYGRSLFVSRADNAVVLEMKKSGNKSIDADFRLEMPENFGAADGEKCVMPDGAETLYDKNFICFAARNDSGLDFGAVAKITCTGGTQTVAPKSLKVRGASSVLVVIKLFVDSQRDREWKKLKDGLAAVKEGYDKLKKPHAALHSKLFNSCKISFGSDGDDFHAEDLLQQAYRGEMTSALLEKLWSYGRYLFVSGADMTDRLFMPVGLWNGEHRAVKGYLDNAQLANCYRHIFKGNLAAMAEPLFKYFDDMTGSFKDNAMRLFGKHGIFVPSVCAPSTGRPGLVNPQCLYDTSLAAVIADLYYKYYLYTKDQKFLNNRALPFMKNAAVFYEEFLTENADGKLETPFSCAPNGADWLQREDRPVIGKDAVVDFEAVRLLLCDLLCVVGEGKESQKWRDMLSKLPDARPVDGVIKPYLQKSCNAANAFGISMLYAAYPGDTVDRTSPSEKIKAYVNTAKDLLCRKSDSLLASYAANLSALFARLGEKELALECLCNVVRGGVVNNLASLDTDWRGMGYLANSVWAAMQLQGNLAITDAVQEMLVDCRGKTVYILPCHIFGGEPLSISGLRCECGCEVALDYTPKNQNLSIRIKGVVDGMEVSLPDGVKKNIKTNCGVVDAAGKIVKITAENGKPCEISCKYTPS